MGKLESRKIILDTRIDNKYTLSMQNELKESTRFNGKCKRCGLKASFLAESRIRTNNPSLRSRLPTLWSRSYYAGSCGAVTEASVRRYIEGQKGK